MTVKKLHKANVYVSNGCLIFEIGNYTWIGESNPTVRAISYTENEHKVVQSITIYLDEGNEITVSGGVFVLYFKDVEEKINE